MKVRFRVISELTGNDLTDKECWLLTSEGRLVYKRGDSLYEDECLKVVFDIDAEEKSTGIILLREIDGEFETPAADNLVYQNFPAIAFGFPMMLLATLAPKKPVLTFIIFVAFFLALNIILFRSFIFRRRKK